MRWSSRIRWALTAVVAVVIDINITHAVPVITVDGNLADWGVTVKDGRAAGSNGINDRAGSLYAPPPEIVTKLMNQEKLSVS